MVEAERPRRILSRLSKDFDGSGEWTLEETDGLTTATLDWRPSVNHALIRRLTPVLRPLFRSSHNGRCATASGRFASTSTRGSYFGSASVSLFEPRCGVPPMRHGERQIREYLDAR